MTAGNLLTFGDICVDLAAERVWRGGELVELEPKAFEVLRHLLHNRDRLVSKQELFDTVWEKTAVTDNALTRVVAQLRRAIGDEARGARYIETVPTRGYRFIAHVDCLAGAGPSASGGAAVPAGPVSPAATTIQPVAAVPTAGRIPEGLGPPAEIEALSPGERVWVRGLWHSRSLTAAIVGGLIVVGAAMLLTLWARPVAGRWEQPAAAPSAHPFGGHLENLPGPPPPGPGKDLEGPLTQVTFSLELDGYASFSPDGTMLAYASLQNGKLDLYVRSFAAGSQTRRVTNDGQQNVQPDWSPDGQYLVYHSIARGGIWVVPAAGGTTRQIAESGSAPRWSPDGRSIVYQSSEVHGLDVPTGIAPSTLSLVTFPGGERRPLTEANGPDGGHSQPAWSADGKRVIFINQFVGPAEVWTVDVATGERSRLMYCPQLCATPVIDVARRALFYTSPEPMRAVWRVPLSADGRQAAGQPEALFTPIDSDIQGLSLRRDGRQLAFTMQTVRSNLESIALTNGRSAGRGASSMPRPLAVTRDTSVRNTWPIISPDGSKLAFMSRRSGSGRHVWVSDLDGAGARQLTFDAAVGPLHTWLPGGDEIAYLSAQNRRIQFMASSLTTGRSRMLRDYGPWSMVERVKWMHARFSPDGGQVVMSQIAGGVMNLWTQDLKTGATRQLTHDHEAAGFPTASEDGKWVAYEVKRGGDAHLAIVPYGGGEERVLTSGRGLYWPHSFAPDGDRIGVAYRVDGLWRIGAISRTTGRLEQLSDPVPASSFVRYPAWSPRNDRIVYEHAQVTGNIWMATLREQPVSGGETASR